jgi:uncharacterized repeat protein (TIGR02543 family)
MVRLCRLLVVGVVLVTVVVANGAGMLNASAVPERTAGFAMSAIDAGSASPDDVLTSTDDSAGQPEKIVIDGKPPLVKVQASSLPEPNPFGATSVLSNVPAFDWSYGCSATAAAMLFGYYDNVGYPNMYTGPANGGVCPMTNAVWGQTVYPGVTCGECPLSASHLGVDGRTTKGHVDDYWVDYGSLTDPFTGNWSEHTPSDSLGDFMGTNQSKYGNSDGSTNFWLYSDGTPLYDYVPPSPNDRDGCHGLHLFAESRGYTVVTNFTQRIAEGLQGVTGGFTFTNLVNEIDAGRPVLIHVTGHTMLAYGYNTADQTVQIRDTWDYSAHTMTWGGTYSGLQHYSVTVIRLAPVTSYTLTVSASPPAGGSVAKSPDQATYTPGTVVTLTGSVSPGYHFEAWSGSITGTTTPVNVTMDGNKTITATFAPNDATVTVASGGNGTVTPVSPFTQTYGASGTAITASPAVGYHFVSWSATSNPTYVTIANSSLASTTVATTSSSPDGGTATVTATFAINTYTVTISGVPAERATSITPASGQTVDHGSSITFSVTPQQLYYIFSTTRNGETTELDVVGRNLGGVRNLEFLNITETTTITVQIYRRGDITGNGASGPDTHVDVLDASILITQWGKTIDDYPDTLLADLNCDGVVNIYDLSMMMSLWN